MSAFDNMPAIVTALSTGRRSASVERRNMSMKSQAVIEGSNA
jgi:hypothetical protein